MNYDQEARYQNLLLEHRAIAQRLNRKVNAQVIEDVLFY